MADSPQREMWLVAAWPGLGNVGLGAAAYLVNKLEARLTHELPGRDVFDLSYIDVHDGLARAGRLPRSMFFEWQNPDAPQNLLIFIGEAQPPDHGHAFCHRLMDYAASRGVTRVITFAAMATQLHPSDTPRAFGVATNGEGIRDLQALDVDLLKEGQITGLNGVLLAVAAERNIGGLCLLGELPFFAATVPNPKASQAVLEVFSSLAKIEVDLEDLREQSRQVEQALLKLLAKLKEATQSEGEGAPGSGPAPAPGSEEGESFAGAADEDESEGGGENEGEDADQESREALPPATPPPRKKEPALDLAARKKIESLFKAANEDHAKAFALKEELDRLGVFKQYEDRFLDLFRKGQ